MDDIILDSKDKFICQPTSCEVDQASHIID